MAWLKLEDTFCDHPKFRRLARELGVSAVTARGHVSTLWCWCLRHAPDGVFASYDSADIADAAEWEGDPEVFLGALVKCRLLVEVDGAYEVHEWMDRAESNRRAQQRRLDRERAKTRGAPRRVPRVDTVAEQSGPRGDEMRGDERRGEEKEELCAADAAPVVASPPDAPSPKSDAEIRTVWAKYREHHTQVPVLLRSSSKNYRLIRARLEEGWSVSDLSTAIDGYHRSPFHLGENDRGKEYLSIGLILRDTDHVQSGLQYFEKAGQPVLSEKTQRGLRAAQSWSERMMSSGKS